MNRSLFQQHEAHIADLIGGRLTRGSGCSYLEKGDVQFGTAEDDMRLMVECKCTQAKEYRLTFDTWDKVNKQARRRSATPIMAVRFCDSHGCLLKDYIVAPEIWANFEPRMGQKSFVLRPEGYVSSQHWISDGNIIYEMMVYSPEEFMERWLDG